MRGGVCQKRYGGWGRSDVRNGWGEGAVEEMNEGRGLCEEGEEEVTVGNCIQEDNLGARSDD